MSTPPKSTAKATAARAEKKAERKALDWRGVTFDLPAKVSGAVLFDWAAIESAEKEVGPLITFLGSLIGDDQVAQVRAKIIEDDIGFEEVTAVILGLINDVFGVYGTAEGESAAS